MKYSEMVTTYLCFLPFLKKTHSFCDQNYQAYSDYYIHMLNRMPFLLAILHNIASQTCAHKTVVCLCRPDTSSATKVVRSQLRVLWDR